VIEVIERGQENIARQLRDADIPTTEALAVMKRYNTFAVQVLRELDDLYREFRELLANDPEREAEQQEWLETKAGGLLLTMEAFIAVLVAEAMNKAKEDYRTELSRPREIIIPTPPQPSPWEEAWEHVGLALRHPVVLLSVGLSTWFLLWWLVSGYLIMAGIAIGVTVFMGIILRKLACG
jgi:hypothetical protein